MGQQPVMAPLIAGALAGSVHVLAGPDHLAAVAPFAMRRQWRAWISGMQWGVGHTLGVAVMSLLAWWLRGSLPLERISGWSEQIVGVVLVAIGLWTVGVAFRRRVHFHRHDHGGVSHVHLHAHGAPRAHGSSHARDHRHVRDHRHAPLWVGVLHGTAGSAHFLAILPALAFDTGAESAAYLIGYSAGTITAMVAFTAALGMISVRLRPDGSGRFYDGFLAVAGSAAIVVGVIWLIP